MNVRTLPILVTLALALCLSVVSPAVAQGPNDVAMNTVDVVEHLGDVVPGDLTFTDHTGALVQLSSFFDGRRPVLLTLNYYDCPMLCGLQLNGLTDSLKGLDWAPGQNYVLVTVSVDPEEGAELAAAKRQSHLQALGRGEVEWHFLTGDQASITTLANAIGYQYAYVPETGEYAHPAVLTFLSPAGRITRYLYGLVYEPRDVRLALLEAAEGTVGTTMDRLILACYMYDPETGGYIRDAWVLMRGGGALTVLLLGLLLIGLWRRDRPVPAAGVTQG